MSDNVKGRQFGGIYVEVDKSAGEVSRNDLGWKYAVPLFEDKQEVARWLRQAADWIDRT